MLIGFKEFTVIWSRPSYKVNVSNHECTIWGPGQKEGEKEEYKDIENKTKKERRNRLRGSRIRK
jgi:hypothetical protein